MNYKRIEDAKVFRRFSTKFDEEYFLVKFQKTSVDGEGEIYLLLKTVGSIAIDEELARSLEEDDAND